MRKLLKRGNFTSLDDLRDQILAFIAYYNHTMWKPIKWTYRGFAQPINGINRGVRCKGINNGGACDEQTLA